jgi:pseudouridine-5'-phosphate glycosidase
MTDASEKIAIAPDVAAALKDRRPVVALESTVVTHGMPFPQNLETARAVEAAVVAAGATPATIAIVHGRMRVGLLDNELEALASTDGALKASRRDLAAVVARQQTAGTTVSATMIIAAMARIPVFATGGIGGVHRGASETFDVSADLTELARTPVTVVCAGAKSILDIPKTLEVLETYGVPVIGYRTDEFPAFFSRSSGEALDVSCESAAEIAAIIRAHRALGLTSGLLVANPILEADAIPASEIEHHIAEALAEADAYGITGKAVTPYLLDRLVRATGGRTLTANMALIRNNARLAAEIAVALATTE